MDAKIAEQAKSVEKDFEEYKKGMDPRQFDYIRSDIIITKLFNFLKAENEMYTEEEAQTKTLEEKKPATKKKAPAKKTAKKDEE